MMKMIGKPTKLIRGILIFAGFICVSLAVVLLFYENTRLRQNTAGVTNPPEEAVHRVLFLSSYNPTYFTSDEKQRGLEKGLYPNGIEYDVMYMDSKLYSSDQDRAGFYVLLKSRLAGNPRGYEAILVSDDPALRFVREHRRDLFAGFPVVFFGINELPLAEEAILDPLMAGIFENDQLGDNLALADSLFPEAQRFIAIHDNTDAGMADVKAFLRHAQEYPGRSFSAVNTEEMSHQELAEVLEALPQDSVIFYMTCYRDGEGKNWSVRQMTRTIVEHCHGIPIIRNYEGSEGEGVLAGVSLDQEAHARQAADLVVQVLDDANMEDMALVMNTPTVTFADYVLLDQYDISPSRFPEGTVFYGRPESFVYRYSRLFLPTLLVLAAVALFLTSTKIANRKLQQTALALQASKEDLERTAGELRASRDDLENTAEELRTSRDELKHSQEELLHQAEYDDFLDILNRRTIMRKLREEYPPDAVYSVIMADLDGFKGLNEDYGHRLADEILKYITALLKELSERNGWLMGRYGGDEFLFIIPGERVTADHPSVQMLLTLFRMPVPAGETEVRLSASLGISTSDGETTSEQHILNAEMAMYEAKKRGRDGAFLFDDEMKGKMKEENRIKGKLLKAFDTDGFYMVYQPQIDAKTMEVSGFEALVRMREPGIYPGQFIPVAEANGWIWRIGRITTKLVIEQLAAWRDAGNALHPVSINYSSNQLGDTGYLEFVENLLKKYRIPPELIEIEITEGVFLDRTAQANHLFDRFKQLGIRLLMDDFGTGYSSLGYLTYIPVDVIKLDKSLVDAYLVDGKDSFVRDVIALVHDLGKEMIIEGVEEAWQFRRLQEFGADTIQGYFFSKPIPPEEAIEFKASVPEA